MGEIIQIILAVFGGIFIYRLSTAKSDNQRMKREIETALKADKVRKEVNEDIDRKDPDELDRHLADKWMRKQGKDSS